MKDIKIIAESICIDGYECNGEVRKVKGNIFDIINDLFYIGRVSEKKLDANYIKFSEGFSLDFKHNREKVTVEGIAQLIIHGGKTNDFIFRTISINKNITVKDLTEYLNELYLEWCESIEDFPSYRLSGLQIDK